MTTGEFILSIDVGTQSIKAMIFDLLGKMHFKQQVPFEPYHSPKPGWAEQDPVLFWRTLCCACTQLWKTSNLPKDAIAGMALTTQRNTCVAVDREGQPLLPAIVWPDQRKTHNLQPVRGPWKWIFNLLGQNETINYFRTEAEANWIAVHKPDIWQRIHKLLLLSGYLTYKLTGRFVDSTGCQVGYLPFDYKRFRWAASWSWKWRCLPTVLEMLPELTPPGSILGHITSDAAAQTGIAKGLPVIAAAADKACEVIGSGAMESSIGCLSYGTTATINVTHKCYVEPIKLLPPYPSAIPGRYTVEAQIYRGFWMVSWFKNEFGYPEKMQAGRQGITPETLFESFLEDVPPCSMGLMLQPYWTPGVKFPGPEAKGAIIGFGDVHTRAHLYRAILEGLAYALREGKERIEKRGKIPITSLRVSGGGSQSRAACQLTADVFGLATVRPHIYETAGLGAAIDAAVGLNFFSDFKSAIKSMTHIGEVYDPNPTVHRLYDEFYREVYQKMYKLLKPLYKKIRSITGYPE
ncbi:MAG: carbohydrate kinase [Desulfobacteraceae bacterium]|nr:carbohydrate kinase [Desulfobacteraceae bacterium]